jgi:hypothetical protein
MGAAEEPLGRGLNLAALARSAGGAPVEVPGWPVEVQSLSAPSAVSGERARWLAVLSGEVLVDLPSGDFRVLKAGDGLAFPLGVRATLRSVARPAVLLWHAAR